MTFEIPLFPLNVVLFPGMPLPLHIFEPRYRRMMGRCLEADRVFGVALLVEGQEGLGGTVPAAVGCTAEILEVAAFADGRMNLQTIGGQRFTILEIREEDEYLIGTCELLEDAPCSEITLETADLTRYQLRKYFQALAATMKLPEELEDLDIPVNPEALSLFIATIIMLPNDQKQTLLEMTSTDNRLQLEAFLLERADIVHRAYARRLERGETEPATDNSLGPVSSYISLN